MELKTTHQIIDENSDLAEKILNQEADIEKYNGEFKNTYEKKWVAVHDIIAKLNHDVDFAWALEKIEGALSEHHTPAENIMNLISHVQYRINEIQKQLGDSNAQTKG